MAQAILRGIRKDEIFARLFFNCDSTEQILVSLKSLPFDCRAMFTNGNPVQDIFKWSLFLVMCSFLIKSSAKSIFSEQTITHFLILKAGCRYITSGASWFLTFFGMMLCGVWTAFFLDDDNKWCFAVLVSGAILGMVQVQLWCGTMRGWD